MKRGRGSAILLILVLFLGLGLLLYPSVSGHWNSLRQSRAISRYADEVAALDETRYAQLWAEAQAFNAKASGRDNPFVLDEAELTEYRRSLDLDGSGVMGYIEIPSIGCFLPIYHGIEERVLQVAIGHLEWSSLPVGGAGSHCVLSGHRGLPSAKLFTDLDRVREGDLFHLRVLDAALTYEVDQILVVEPDDTAPLMIQAGRDYCTLVTCTPYGVNSHRLLVRGRRVDNAKEGKTASAARNAAADPCPKDNACPIAKFNDANATEWYHDGVHYCVEQGLMVGTSETTFAPAMTTSRAMLATILWREAGSPVVNYALAYDDVEQDTWYAEAVRWATAQGVVKDYGNGKFGPNDPITREQLAAMLYRCAGEPETAGTLDSFTDAGQVSGYAEAALRWAAGSGVIQGKGGGVLDPQGQATRAEAATMFQRFCEGER